jgi:chromosome segregation ATPase
MAKMPNIHDDVELPDLSGWKQKFVDLRGQRDLLESQMRDMEKSLAVAEAKVEKLDAENSQLRGRLENIQAQATEWRTLISGIAQMIIPVMKGDRQANHQLTGSPPRLVRPEWAKPESSAEAINRIAEGMRATLREEEPPATPS